MSAKRISRGRRRALATIDDMRRARGYVLRRKVLGGEFDRAYRGTELIAPMHDLVARVCWGDVWQRPGLTHKQRCLINIGVLVALRLPNELKAFIRGALRSGLTFKQVQEALLQTAVYCGFPSAINGFRCASEVLEEPEIKRLLQARGRRPRARRG